MVRDRRLAVFLAGSLLILALARPLGAKTMYVVDELVVTIRDGKSASSETIARLKSLDSVEIEEMDGEWAKVRLPSGQVGWLQSKYLVSEPPAGLKVKEMEAQVASLSAEIESLKAKNAQLAESNERLRADLETTASSLAKAQEETRALSRDSEGYQALKDEYEQMRAELEKIRSERNALRRASDQTLNQRRLKWFAVGGGVLLVGWIIGAISSRRRRRYDSRFY